MHTNTIDEVIAHLDIIIEDCMQKSSRAGYFAILYKKMTLAVKKGIALNQFEDGDRMEKLDVHFANRYLDAYYAFASGKPLTQSWQSAFNAVQNNDLAIVQHLLLGINAHINLDLGISAAAISNRDNIHLLHNDYNKINVVIADVYGSLQNKLKKISWLTIFLKNISPNTADSIINFSISKARDTAWNNALLLVNSGNHQANVIQTADAVVHKVANAIQSPGRITKFLLKWIVKAESKDIANNLRYLNEND